MDKERVKELAANVNSLIGNYQDQQKNTAELFKICLEFLEDKRTGHGVYISAADIQRAGGVFKAERAALIKRKERKQQLIAAVKGYITMIETREKSDEVEIPEELK
jgi:hypothetical protein